MVFFPLLNAMAQRISDLRKFGIGMEELANGTNEKSMSNQTTIDGIE